MLRWLVTHAQRWLFRLNPKIDDLILMCRKNTDLKKKTYIFIRSSSAKRSSENQPLPTIRNHCSNEIRKDDMGLARHHTATPTEILTCSRVERGNGRWRGKTSQPCPPSSSTNDSERETAKNHGFTDARVHSPRSRGHRRHSLPAAQAKMCPLPPLTLPSAPFRFGRNPCRSDEPAQHHHPARSPHTEGRREGGRREGVDGSEAVRISGARRKRA